MRVKTLSNIVTKLGDSTSKNTTPDFESERAYYWMKQVRAIQEHGSSVPIPRKPRSTLAEKSFFSSVDARVSRRCFTVNIAFDKEGKRIHEDT